MSKISLLLARRGSRIAPVCVGVLFVGLVFSFPAHARDHYVRADATGLNTGASWTDACTDFTDACAVSSLVRGDTYYVAGGTYGSSNFNRAIAGKSLITIRKATLAQHGQNAGWKDSYGIAPAVFNGQINFGSSYWIFDGAEGGGPEQWTSGFGFRISKSGPTPALRTDKVSNVTVRHIEIQGTLDANGGGSIAQDGVALYGATSFLLSRYYIHDVGRCPFFLSTQDFIAEYGYTGKFVSTSAAHAELASIWGFAIPANRVTFRYNLFTFTAGTGGLIFDNQEDPRGGGMKVYGNIFYQPPGELWEGGNGAIGGWTGGHGEQFHQVEVYNNSFINLVIPPLGTLPRIASGNVAKNNLFYNTASPSFTVFGDHDSNAFYQSGDNHGEVNAQVESGNPFADLAALNFHLTGHTRAGSSLPAPYDLDPEKLVRGLAGLWDRGAFQCVRSTARAANPS